MTTQRITYRGDWHIYPSTVSYDPKFDWSFCHDDYDGAPDGNDTRCGHGQSVQDCKAQIDAWEEEHEAS